jgi:hypothetical protein
VKHGQVMWILAVALAPLPALAQASQPAQAPQPPQAPQAAQTAQSPQTPPPPPKKAKKVWDNDELAKLIGGGEIPTTATAVVLPPEPLPGAQASAPQAPKELPPEKDPKYYQEKLAALRKRLADLEAKISDTQAAMNGSQGGSNAIKLNDPTPILRPEDQLAAFEKEKKDVQQQIDDLETQAAQNGLSPGDIR